MYEDQVVEGLLQEQGSAAHTALNGQEAGINQAPQQQRATTCGWVPV